jgi:hypothetical protein
LLSHAPMGAQILKIRYANGQVPLGLVTMPRMPHQEITKPVPTGRRRYMRMQNGREMTISPACDVS